MVLYYTLTTQTRYYTAERITILERLIFADSSGDENLPPSFDFHHLLVGLTQSLSKRY